MASAQTLREEKVNGRDAWVLDNGLIRITVLRGGGHLGEIKLVSSDPKAAINPMRVPHYPTIEPFNYDPAKHDAIYGDGPSRWLMSGYMGHLLCFPFYGQPSSDEEIRAGLGGHGEAPISEWKKTHVEADESGVRLHYSATLPRTQYRVERVITLPKGKRWARVEEWVENLAGYDRPFQWMQHATFGPPFIEPGRTFLDASATKGQVGSGASDRSLKPDSAIDWPKGVGHEGKPVDLRAFQTRPSSGVYYALLMDRSRKDQFFTLYHRDYKVLIGYLYPTEGNLWLADWQENKGNKPVPWNNQVIARGLEFGNSPFAEGLRKAVERGSLFGVPAFGWIGAHQRLKTEFTVFLEQIPEGYAGVADARWDDASHTVRITARQ